MTATLARTDIERTVRDVLGRRFAAGARSKPNPLVVNISASPWQRGKEATRLAMLQQVARDESMPLVQVNMTGANDELIFDGAGSDRAQPSVRWPRLERFHGLYRPLPVVAALF